MCRKRTETDSRFGFRSEAANRRRSERKRKGSGLNGQIEIRRVEARWSSKSRSKVVEIQAKSANGAIADNIRQIIDRSWARIRSATACCALQFGAKKRSGT